MWEIFIWNVLIVCWLTVVAGFIAETGERAVAMKVIWYLGFMLSMIFWFFVLVVVVALRGTS